MTYAVKVLSIHRSADLDLFYETGSSIRRGQLPFNLPWTEEKNIGSVFENSAFIPHLLLIDSDQVQARLLAFLDPIHPAQGYIGWYECTHNEVAHQALLNEAFVWLKTHGCQVVTGPLNGTTWNPYRFNMTADFPIFPGEPYQPNYYPEFWLRSGFEPSLTYVTEIPPKSVVHPMDEATLTTILSGNQFRHLKITPEISDRYAAKLHAFYHLCFASNPLFQPISEAAYKTISDKTTAIVSPDHSFLILDHRDEIAGIFLSFVDYYHQHYSNLPDAPADYKKNRLVIKTLAVHPDYRNKQLGTLMINYIHNMAYKSGYEEVIHALMYVDNISAKKGKEKFQTEILRSYALLQQRL